MAQALEVRVLRPAKVWGDVTPTERSLDLRIKNMVAVLVRAALQ
jgi:hypothetical protein